MSPLSIKSQEMHAKKTIDISKSDYCLFGSNVAFLATLALDYSGYSSQLLKNVLNVTQLATVLGESLASAPSFDRLYTALPGLALFGTRLFIDNQAKSNPSLRVISLGLNAYGTCVLAKKALTEAVKCYHLSSKNMISNLDIAKVYVIHGTNALASLFRTCTAATDYETLNSIERSKTIAQKIKNTYRDKYPHANQQDINNFDARIDKLLETIRREGINVPGLYADNELLRIMDEELKRPSCVGSGDGPTWNQRADDRVTNELGMFKPEVLKKLRIRDCFSSWKDYYLKYPNEIPKKAL